MSSEDEKQDEEELKKHTNELLLESDDEIRSFVEDIKIPLYDITIADWI